VGPEVIIRIERRSPHKEPIIAKKLLTALANLSFFLDNKELIAPAAKNEIRMVKLI